MVGGVGRGGIDAMDRQGSKGAAEDISALARGLLFVLEGFLGLKGPDFPCHSGFGQGSKAVPVEAEFWKAAQG